MGSGRGEQEKREQRMSIHEERSHRLRTAQTRTRKPTRLHKNTSAPTNRQQSRDSKKEKNSQQSRLHWCSVVKFGVADTQRTRAGSGEERDRAPLWGEDGGGRRDAPRRRQRCGGSASYTGTSPTPTHKQTRAGSPSTRGASPRLLWEPLRLVAPAPSPAVIACVSCAPPKLLCQFKRRRNQCTARTHMHTHWYPRNPSAATQPNPPAPH